MSHYERFTACRVDNVSATCYTSIIINKKGKLMGNLIEALCQRCTKESNTSTRIQDLCPLHFFEWQEEKMYNDFDRSTEGLYL